MYICISIWCICSICMHILECFYSSRFLYDFFWKFFGVTHLSWYWLPMPHPNLSLFVPLFSFSPSFHYVLSPFSGWPFIHYLLLISMVITNKIHISEESTTEGNHTISVFESRLPYSEWCFQLHSFPCEFHNFVFNCWIIFHCINIRNFHSSVIIWWTSRLFSFLGDCE